MAKDDHTSVTRLAKRERRIKVRKGYYARIIKDRHHIAFDRTVYSPVPWINIQGLWLEQAGFSINTPIKVVVSEGRLILTTS